MRLVDVTLNLTIVIAACVVTMWVATSVHASRSAAIQSPSSVTPTNSTRRGGATDVAVPGLDFREADATILFVVSSSCAYCANSAPAFREITERARHSAQRVRTVAVASEAVSTLRQYLAGQDLIVDRVYALDAASPLTEYTPRVLVVGSDGVVRREWKGLMAAGQSREVSDTADRAR
jgi:hypothetical protein